MSMEGAMTHPRVRWLVATAILVLPVGAAFGQTCTLTIEGAVDRSRREAVLRFVERVREREQAEWLDHGTYVALADTGVLSDAPVGFVPRLVFDRWGYLLSVKDLFDPCGFAVFSDEFGIVYEALPTRHTANGSSQRRQLDRDEEQARTPVQAEEP
jgi:hypothetical protein